MVGVRLKSVSARKVLNGLKMYAALLKKSPTELGVAVMEDVKKYANEILEQKSKDFKKWSLARGYVPISEAWKINENKGKGATLINYSHHGLVAEFGHGVLTPTHGRAMHWKDIHTNDDVFRTKVGPTEPKYFFRGAQDKARKEWKKLITKAFNEKYTLRKMK